MRRVYVGLAILAIVLVPIGARANDQRIAQQIVERLQQEKQKGTIKNFSIDLQVKEGAVRLKGYVSESSHEQLALDIARRVEGVQHVYNELDVKAKPSSRQAANAPAAPAPNKASPEPQKEPTELKPVNHTNPRPEPATLPPTVTERSPAGPDRTAERPKEPRALKDPPRQESASEPSADQIAQEVVRRLQKQKDDGKLLNFGIDIDVQDGAVWLSGNVASEDQRQLVLEQARYVSGVKQVVNDLSISAPKETQEPAAPIVQFNNRTQPVQYVPVQQMAAARSAQTPLAFAPARPVNYENAAAAAAPGAPPVPMSGSGVGIGPARFDNPQLPAYAWPSYAPYPNYGALTYPRQYSPTAWPYIGPFYPYPQVPLGWRKVTLEWDDGWWQLDFKSHH